MTRNSLDPSTLALWQATALCVGLVLLVVPLIALPVVTGQFLGPLLPVGSEVVSASTGIALSLATFLLAGPLLGIPPAAVFVRRPDRTTLPWVGFGCLLVTTVAAAALLAAGGTIDIAHGRGPAPLRTLLRAALVATWPAVLEELLMRGYLLGVVGRRWNWPAAVAVTSALFALLHHGHATGAPSLVLYVGATGVAGVLFALVTLSTGTVWNAVAMHAVWNTLFDPEILRFRAGGETAGAALVTVPSPTGSLWFGGDVVGVPNSPLAILVLAAGVGAVVGLDRRRAA